MSGCRSATTDRVWLADPNHDPVMQPIQLLSLLGLLAVFVPARSARALPQAPRPLATPAPTVLFDTTDDGSVWARGRDYKLRFGHSSTDFYPLLGPRSASMPFGLSVAEVLVDGRALPLDRPGAWSRTDATLRRSHGAMTELWRLEPFQAEQDFELPTGFPRGEVVLRLRVDTPLRGPVAEPGGGLRFEADGTGGVFYGETVVYDRADNRITRPTVFRDGCLELTVPATFMLLAEGPVVVDPIVRSIVVAGGRAIEQRSDVAYSAPSDTWLVVYEELVSTTDRDVHARMYDRDGNLLRELAVEISTADTSTPAVAAHGGADQFLVVWAEAGTGTSSIRGRQIRASSGLQGGPLTFAVGATTPVPTAVSHPDVGGAAHAGTNGYLVAWSRTGADPDVEGRTVSATGVLGSSFTLAGGPASQTLPAISKSAGPAGRWMVAYSTVGPLAEDIFCAVVDATGSILVQDVAVTGSVAQDTLPDVAGDGDDFFVVWSHDPNGAATIHGRRFRFDTTLVPLATELDLTAAEPGGTGSSPQRTPRLAGHGCRYTYCYVEAPGAVLVSTVVTAGTLAFVEGRVPLPGAGSLRTGGLAARADTAPTGGTELVMASLWSTDVFASLLDPLGPSAITRVRTGCGVGREEPTISTSGDAALGGSLTVNLFVGTEIPFLLVGIPITPQSQCNAGCAFGVQTLETLPFASTTFPIPCSPELVGVQVGFQGVQAIRSLFSSNRCGPPQWRISFRTTDTLIVTLR